MVFLAVLGPNSYSSRFSVWLVIPSILQYLTVYLVLLRSIYNPEIIEIEFVLVRKAYLDQNERMSCLVKLSVTHVHVQTSKEIKLNNNLQK